MNNRIAVLLLSKKLKEHLQSNQSVKEEIVCQVLLAIDRLIEELESKYAKKVVSCERILNLLTNIAKALPCIENIIFLISKYWK